MGIIDSIGGYLSQRSEIAAERRKLELSTLQLQNISTETTLSAYKGSRKSRQDDWNDRDGSADTDLLQQLEKLLGKDASQEAAKRMGYTVENKELH